MRRSVYWEHGGLDDQYEFPSIEDIEFGTRLTGAGHRILLDPKIQCTHLKRWTLLNLVKTDVVDRAVPWTLLILRTRRMPRDLNLGLRQRFAGLIAMCMPGMLIAALAAAASDGLFVEAETWFALFLFALGAVVLLNRRLLSFFASRRGWFFAAASVPMLVAYYWYSVIALGMAAGMFVVSPKTHVRNALPRVACPLPALKDSVPPPRVK